MTDDELRSLCEAHANDRAVRDQADARVKDYALQIGTELAFRGVSKADVGPFALAIVDGRRTTLSRERLLELGVSIDVIKQAETVTAMSSVRVTIKKGWVG